MKKVLLTFALIASIGISVVSCKSEAKKESEEVNTEVVEEVIEVSEDAENLDIAVVTYQCPMKCEGDKTYEAPGQCPTCEMELKEVESDTDNDHEEEDHDAEDNDSEDTEA